MGEKLGLRAPNLPRGDFEHLLVGHVEVTDEVISIDDCCLEGIGERRYRRCTKGKSVEAVLGIARYQWKSEAERASFREDQQQPKRNKNRTKPGNRWTDVQDLVASIRGGCRLPLPPLLHPSLHGNQGLWVIDGCRRFVAHVEAQTAGFSVAVIRPAHVGPDHGRPEERTSGCT